MINIQAHADNLTREQCARLIDAYVEHLEEKENSEKVRARTEARQKRQVSPPRNVHAVIQRMVAHLDRHPTDLASRAYMTKLAAKHNIQVLT